MCVQNLKELPTEKSQRGFANIMYMPFKFPLSGPLWGLFYYAIYSKTNMVFKTLLYVHKTVSNNTKSLLHLQIKQNITGILSGVSLLVKMSLSNRLDFTPWLLYSSTHHFPEDFIQLKTAGYEDAWTQ